MRKPHIVIATGRIMGENYTMSEGFVMVAGVITDYNHANTTIKSIVKERLATVFARYNTQDVRIQNGEFQAVMHDAHDAMRMILEQRAMLKQLTHKLHPKGLDTRTSIGFGDWSDDVNAELQTASAWDRAATGLSELETRNGRISVTTGNQEIDAILGTTLRLLDRVVFGWSSSQAAAMEYALQGLTQHQIADILHITQPSVNNRLKLAQWSEIEHIIDVWETLTFSKSKSEILY